MCMWWRGVWPMPPGQIRYGAEAAFRTRTRSGMGCWSGCEAVCENEGRAIAEGPGSPFPLLPSLWERKRLHSFAFAVDTGGDAPHRSLMGGDIGRAFRAPKFFFAR